MGRGQGGEQIRHPVLERARTGRKSADLMMLVTVDVEILRHR
jgi:hypothetical protein